MPAMMKIKIMGEEYSIRAAADEEYLKNIVKFVDGKMLEIKEGLALNSPHKIAILAALNIADEYFKQKNIYESAIKELEEKLQTLSSSLDIL